MNNTFDTGAKQPQKALIPPARSSKDKEPRCEVALRHWQLAARMKQFLVARGKILSIQRRKWADALAKMDRELSRQQIGFDAVEAMWAWYETHCADAKLSLPAITSAEHLRACWDWLSRCKARCEDKRPLAGEEINPETLSVLEQLSLLTWRADVDPIVPTAVQRSCVAVRRFLERLSAVPEGSSQRGAAECVLTAFGSVSAAVVRYFRWLNQDKDRRWAKWNGDLLRWTWDLQRPECVAEARQALRKYTGHDDAWDRLMNELEGRNDG